MKDNTKLAIVFTLALGLMSGAAMAETDNEMAGGRLLAHLAQQGAAFNDRTEVAALQTEFGHVDYVYDFDSAEKLPASTPSPAALTDIAPTTPQKPPVTMLARADSPSSDGADVAYGARWSKTVFYERSPTTPDGFVGWICAEDAMGALDSFVRAMAKEQGFNLEEFAQANKDVDNGAYGARLADLVLNKDQKLTVHMMTGKIDVEAYMNQLIAQLRKTKLGDDFILPEGVHVLRTAAAAYKELDPQYKPKGGIVVNKLAEDCCKGVPK